MRVSITVAGVFLLVATVSSDLIDQKLIRVKSSSGHEVNINWKKRDLTVYNGVTPDVVGNGVARTSDKATSSQEPKSPGITVHAGKVLSQQNLTVRKRREIIQNIHEVHKQINISKRYANARVSDRGNGTNAKTKRGTEVVDTINQQTNIDMGN